MARSSDSESEIVFLNELNSNGSSSEENKIDIELSSITHAVDGISISGKDNSRVDMEGGVVVTGGQNYTRSDSINLGLFDDSSDECDGIDLADEQSEKVETDVLTPGSKLGDVQSTMHTKLKAKLEVRSNSEAEMENILERFSEESCGNKLKETLEEIGGEKYQLVVEKSANTDEEEEDFCCICRDEHNNPKVLPKCSHKFCTECIDQYFRIKPVCPVCFVAYGVITGNQPKGHMSDRVLPKLHLPGYEKYDTITIHYSFGDGTQTDEHPKPGKPYYGTSRTAYLPNSPEGKKVLRLLKEAFRRRLTFTVGHSRTTGADDVVTWNDIHHKTCTHGGQENFGYPDATYLERVQQELAAFGVTEDSL